MTISMSLEYGMKCYSSKNYNEAIECFSHLKKNTKSLEEQAKICLWLGKCYFQKKEFYSFTYRSQYCVGRGSYGVTAPGPVAIGYTQRRMTNMALIYLNTALVNNFLLADAYYWKGRVFQYCGKIQKAYENYVQAAKFSKKNRFFKKCTLLFSQHKKLPFIATIDLEDIPLNEAILNLSSKESYMRMEACVVLSELLKKNLNQNEIAVIKNKMSKVAGYKLYHFYIPGTGDPDLRIRDIARSIINSF